LRLEGNGLGVGNAVAKLGALTAANDAWVGVKILDSEVFAAELLESQAIGFALLPGFFFRVAALNIAIFLPAGIESQDNKEGNDSENRT
jgi:hypothetical protein